MWSPAARLYNTSMASCSPPLTIRDLIKNGKAKEVTNKSGKVIGHSIALGAESIAESIVTESSTTSTTGWTGDGNTHIVPAIHTVPNGQKIVWQSQHTPWIHEKEEDLGSDELVLDLSELNPSDLKNLVDYWLESTEGNDELSSSARCGERLVKKLFMEAIDEMQETESESEEYDD